MKGNRKKEEMELLKHSALHLPKMIYIFGCIITIMTTIETETCYMSNSVGLLPEERIKIHF